MNWQMVGAIAAVVVPVGGLIVGLIVTSLNRQIDLVNRRFDETNAENRAAHAQIGANVDGLRSDVAALRATVDALLLELVPEGEARR